MSSGVISFIAVMIKEFGVIVILILLFLLLFLCQGRCIIVQFPYGSLVCVN